MPVDLVPPLPETLQVEVTSPCNLRCAMCLVRYRPPVNKLAGAIPLAMVRGLLDDLPGLRQLTLQGLGRCSRRTCCPWCATPSSARSGSGSTATPPC